jgi:hypothetical protein
VRAAEFNSHARLRSLTDRQCRAALRNSRHRAGYQVPACAAAESIRPSRDLQRHTIDLRLTRLASGRPNRAVAFPSIFEVTHTHTHTIEIVHETFRGGIDCCR